MMNRYEQLPPDEEAESPQRERRGLAVAAAAALAGLLMMLAVGTAGAETVTAAEIAGSTGARTITQVSAVALQDEPDRSLAQDDAEVDAVFDRFEACLEAQGVEMDHQHVEAADADANGGAWSFELEADVGELDAAFDECDPILDELDDFAEFLVLGPDHEAGFELFDECLTDAGVAIGGAVDVDDEAWSFELDADLDAIFESCDSFLGEMGEVFHGEILELDPADEAVFERFEACLADAGADIEGAASFTIDIDVHDVEDHDEDLDGAVEAWSMALDAELDVAFEECVPILDDLSDSAGRVWFDEPGSFSLELDLGLDQDD